MRCCHLQQKSGKSFAAQFIMLSACTHVHQKNKSASRSPQSTFNIVVKLTDSCAILSHNALHRSDDLLHHRRRHGGGVDRTVGMGAQVLNKLLNTADTQEM